MKTTRNDFRSVVLLAVLACAAIAPPARAQATADIWLDAGQGGGDIGTPGFDHVQVEKTIASQLYVQRMLLSRILATRSTPLG